MNQQNTMNQRLTLNQQKAREELRKGRRKNAEYTDEYKRIEDKYLNQDNMRQSLNFDIAKIVWYYDDEGYYALIYAVALRVQTMVLHDYTSDEFHIKWANRMLDNLYEPKCSKYVKHILDMISNELNNVDSVTNRKPPLNNKRIEAFEYLRRPP